MASLKAKVLRGSLWGIAGGAGQQAANFIILLYLARALSPAEVGLVTLAAVLIELVCLMGKLGVVEALQSRQPDRAVETALLVTLGVAGVIGAGLIVLAAGGAWLANYDRVFVMVVLLMAPIALFQAINALPEALFKRNLNYRSLAFRSWSATIGGGVIAVIMADRGYGVFAMVGQRLAVTLISTLLLWIQVGWRPTRQFVVRDSWPVLAIGWKITVASLSSLFSQRVMDLITGGFLGAAPLGYLRVSAQVRDALGHFVLYPITGISIASLGRLKDDSEARTRAYLRILQLMALVSLPAYFGMGALAEPLIEVVLGTKWLGAVVVFQLFGALMVARSATYFFGPIMIAVGRGDVILRQSIAQALMTIPIIWVGSYGGLIGVILAQVTCAAITSVFNMAAARRYANIPVLRTIGAIAPAAIAAAAMYVIVTTVLAHVDLTTNVAKLALGGVVGVLSYASILIIGDIAGIWKEYARSSARSVWTAAQRG